MLWLLLAAALAAASVLAWWGDTVWLDWQPQRAWPEAWRWWTAALVHWTPMHLGANLLATALVAACVKPRPPVPLLPWPVIVQRALASTDVHVIKLVDACREEDAAHGASHHGNAWQQAASRAVTPA